MSSSSLGTTQKLVLAFVTLLLGVILIGTVAQGALDRTTKAIVTDEAASLTSCYTGDLQVDESSANCNFTVTNAPTGWIQTENLDLENVVVDNGTGTPLTVTTDYNLFADTGIIQFKNTTATDDSVGNATTFSYEYYRSDYMNLTWGRTLLQLISGFFAIALVGIAVGLFYSVAKDFGII